MLQIKNLDIHLKDSENQYKQIIKNLSLEVSENEILAKVGESGSGKSITSLSIMGLLPNEISKTSGEIIFEDKNLINYTD